MSLQLRAITTLYAIAVSLALFKIIVPHTALQKQMTAYFITPLSSDVTVLADHTQNAPRAYKVFGFLPYWKLDETEFLQLNKLTDIAYFSLGIEANGEIKTHDAEGNIDAGYNNWQNNGELTNFIQKAQNNGVAFSLTVISHNDEITQEFLSCPSCWQTLIDNLTLELNAKSIKNVNFDFESSEYVDPAIAQKYTEFVKFAHTALDKEFGDSFVTVSAFADSFVKPRMTEVTGLAQTVDAFFIMAYDFHYPNSDTAGPVSPIGGAGELVNYDINTMLKDYLKNVPPSKLIMGVPYYGYNWVVESADQYATRIPGNDYIGYSTSQPYEGINETILKIRPQILWDSTAQVPYFSYVSPQTGSLRMVYYENVDSLRIKYKLIKSNGLLGVGIWALGYDGGYQELWNLLQSEFLVQEI